MTLEATLGEKPKRGRLASRLKGLGGESAFEVLVKARALEAKGVGVIHLEIGEPDFSTPGHIVEAAFDAIGDGHTRYGPPNGLPELREAIAGYAEETRGIAVDPDHIVVTPGAKPILFYSILALVEPGDEVIFPDPSFPTYQSVINLSGARPVPVGLREERAFSFDVDDLRSKITDKTRMIILNSPANPTGGVLGEDDLGEIARLAVEHDIIVLSDEIYSRIVYEGKHHSIASFPGMQERTILLDGFSKTYAMTGWRLGYGVMPSFLAPHVACLVTNSVSCTSSFTQRAGLRAIKDSQESTVRMVQEFRRRRDVVVDGLNSIPGFHCLRPAGAFYAFPNIRDTGFTSAALADYLLQEAGVALLSGASFGDYGEGYLRLSYANSVENLQRALERIRVALEKI